MSFSPDLTVQTNSREPVLCSAVNTEKREVNVFASHQNLRCRRCCFFLLLHHAAEMIVTRLPQLYIATEQVNIRCFSLDSGNLLRTLVGHRGSVSCMHYRFHPCFVCGVDAQPLFSPPQCLCYVCTVYVTLSLFMSRFHCLCYAFTVYVTLSLFMSRFHCLCYAFTVYVTFSLFMLRVHCLCSFFVYYIMCYYFIVVLAFTQS
jgi:hypothetical protein